MPSSVVVCTTLTVPEAKRLDLARGTRSRADFLREMAFRGMGKQ